MGREQPVIGGELVSAVKTPLQDRKGPFIQVASYRSIIIDLSRGVAPVQQKKSSSWILGFRDVGRFDPQFPSEEAVMVSALKAMKGQKTSPALEDWIDLDFEACCAREGDDAISLEEVREATSKIPGSMAEAIIEDERAERF
jgi:hypothetical protein